MYIYHDADSIIFSIPLWVFYTNIMRLCFFVIVKFTSHGTICPFFLPTYLPTYLPTSFSVALCWSLVFTLFPLLLSLFLSFFIFSFFFSFCLASFLFSYFLFLPLFFDAEWRQRLLNLSSALTSTSWRSVALLDPKSCSEIYNFVFFFFVWINL